MHTYLVILESWYYDDQTGLDVGLKTSFIKGSSKRDAVDRLAKNSSPFYGGSVHKFLRISRKRKTPRKLVFQDLPF